MMPKIISAYAFAGLLAAAAAGVVAQEVPTEPDPALSSLSVEQMVQMRKDMMREDGRVLRNAASLSGEEAVAGARTLVVNFTNFPALFPEGSITPDSHALPVIWEDWETFTGMFAQAREHSVAGLTAAEAGDAAGFTAAVQPIGQLCGQCHDQFRAPTD